MDVLLRLQRWYAAQCDGDWEHSYGVHIGTLDNPGWRVRINLTGTSLEGRPFQEVAEGVGAEARADDSPWAHCWVKDDEWHAATDPEQLARVLQLFLDWAESSA